MGDLSKLKANTGNGEDGLWLGNNIMWTAGNTYM